MSSNVKSTPVSRHVDAHMTETIIKWISIPTLMVAGYIGLCVWFAHIRATNGMAHSVVSPFGELTQFDGGLPNWEPLVKMANTGDFFVAYGLWLLAGVVAIVVTIFIRRSSFIRGYRNS